MSEDNKSIKSKSSFFKDFRNIIILILIILLSILCALLFRNIDTQSQIATLQTDIQTLTVSNTELSSKIEDNNSKIAELETSNNNLQEEMNTLNVEKNALKEEKTALENEIQQLKKNNKSLSSQISTIKKSSNTTTPVQTTISTPYEIGTWNTSVTSTEFSPETHTRVEKTFITKYDFKDNGDFYVNGNKVGTYKDGSIFFKDSNDTNYRTASYKINNNILYVNLFENSSDICVSSDFYPCTKD